VNRDPLERSALAVGLDWAARVTSIGLEFALPALLGVWVDRWLGTRPLATVLGTILGFCVGILQLVKIASRTSEDQASRRRRGTGKG
jgi:F0F1-type ATP synthase assembly protein I